MKKILIISLLCSIALNSYSQSFFDSNKSSLGRQGVVYQLTVMKYGAEASMLDAIKNNKDVDAATKNYQKLKAEFDAALNQFLLEMNNRNGLARKFKKINKAFKNNKQSNQKYCNPDIQIWADAINTYIFDCHRFINSPHKIVTAEGFDATNVDPVAVITLGWTIFKDVKDLQAKKSDGLSAILNSLRLSSVSDLKGK